MKRDKKWFLKTLEGVATTDDYGNEFNGGYEEGLNTAYELALQLDEQGITQEQAWEVLAPRFSMTAIELEREVSDGFLAMTVEEIEMESFKIKQLADGIKKLHAENKALKAKLEESEKVVVPQFVADWWGRDGDSVTMYGGESIDKKRKIHLISNFNDRGLGDHLSKVEDWIDENESSFLDLVSGKVYEVEEEQKYYTLDPEDIPLLERRGNKIQRTATELNIYVKGRDVSRFELTEQEIKDYDERFWSFAVEVEE